MAKTKSIIIGIVIAVLLLLGGWAGYKIYPIRHPCPVIVSDTFYYYDSVPHIIWDTVPWYHLVLDSIPYPDTQYVNIDTGKIINDYFARHYFTREWKDSLLSVTLKDVITQNKPVDNSFTYKLLRPQTVINNSTNSYSYSRYITVGADFPFKSIKHLNMNLELKYISPKWNVGIGYDAELNCPTVSIGATVLKLK